LTGVASLCRIRNQLSIRRRHFSALQRRIFPTTRNRLNVAVGTDGQGQRGFYSVYEHWEKPRPKLNSKVSEQ